MAPPSLREQFQTRERRAPLIEDALQVLDAEVQSKSGLGGLAIKAAFGVLKGVSPGILKQIIDKLLDDFLESVDPVYQRAIAEGRTAGALISQEKSSVADALLRVTDRKAAAVKSETLKKTYEKLRPSAQKHVEEAAPRLAELLDKHAQAS